MKKTIIITLASLALIGCAGRAANPVMVQQYGDTNKSCDVLTHDMSFIESEVARLIPDTEKTGKNVALGVTGAFFLVPLFFMDFSQAEQMEVNAYRQRYNHLASIALDKGCSNVELMPIPTPENITTEDKAQINTGS